MLDVVYPPYHRGLFINGDVHKHLENSLKEITDHTGRKFQSKVTDGVVKYKKNTDIFHKVHNLHNKKMTEILTNDDVVNIEAHDKLVTSKIRIIEGKIKKKIK